MSIILISAPAFSYVTNSSQCDNDVLSTYSGSANLTANWQGNPISVTWYNGDTQYDSNSCTYGGNLTMPSSIPQKTGYTFKGWRVRQASGNGGGQQAQQCIFASSVCGLSSSQISGLEISDIGIMSHDGTQQYNANPYGLTTGTWALEFTNGGVARGIASCNNIKSNIWDTALAALVEDNDVETFGTLLWGTCNTDTFKPGDTFDNSVDGQYCWCKMTSYTPNNSDACNISSSAWIFLGDYDDPSECAYQCAGDCLVDTTIEFDRARFIAQYQ